MSYIQQLLKRALLTVLVIGFVSVAMPVAEASYHDQSQNRFQGLTQAQTQLHLQSREQLQVVLQQLITLLNRLREMRQERFGGGGDDFDQANDFNIITQSADSIGDDNATLRGRLDIDDADEVEVWFEYGTDSDDLEERTDRATLDEDADFEEDVVDLDEDTSYYFRAVGENENGDRDHGAIANFTTGEGDDTEDDMDHPDLDTTPATSIRDDEAELNGEVEMNDFDNGLVFFVYGTDEDLVEEVANEFDTYSDIDEEGDDLQKVDVEDGFDGSAKFEVTIEDLDDGTDYHFSICVQYEEEGGDDTIRCGDVDDFETDD